MLVNNKGGYTTNKPRSVDGALCALVPSFKSQASSPKLQVPSFQDDQAHKDSARSLREVVDVERPNGV